VRGSTIPSILLCIAPGAGYDLSDLILNILSSIGAGRTESPVGLAVQIAIATSTSAPGPTASTPRAARSHPAGDSALESHGG
jgi:hypothetical protein